MTRSYSLTTSGLVAAAVAGSLLLLTLGCNHHCCRAGACFPGGPGATHYPCYGYHSTCWRMWPPDCPVCPPPVEVQPVLSAPMEQLTPPPPMAIPPTPDPGP